MYRFLCGKTLLNKTLRTLQPVRLVPIPTLSFTSPLLALPHDDTDSAAEIKGRALIANGTKCRPAAQGIRPHYKHRCSQLRAVMTNHTKQLVDNRDNPALSCLTMTPFNAFCCARFCDEILKLKARPLLLRTI